MAIIYDREGYKLDAQWQKSTKAGNNEWWFEITSFRRRKDANEWVTKTTRFSPETQHALRKMLQNPPSEEGKETSMARRRTEKIQENVATMLLECVAAGAYYWFRAESPDENMASALNRMRYRQMVERFDALNIPRPTPEEMYAYAVEKWPSHKLRAAPKVV